MHMSLSYCSINMAAEEPVVPVSRATVLRQVRAKTNDELVRFAALDPAPNL